MWWIELHSIEDIYKLVEFEKEVHSEKDCMTVEEYKSWYDLGLRTTVLKDNNGEWKGSYQTINNGKDSILFAGFGRHPVYKGKGIGQILMNRLIARSKGKLLICETRHDNKSMIRLLENNGFVFVYDEIKEDDCWTWWKYESKNRT